jgi:hypothetical protein
LTLIGLGIRAKTPRSRLLQRVTRQVTHNRPSAG